MSFLNNVIKKIIEKHQKADVKVGGVRPVTNTPVPIYTAEVDNSEAADKLEKFFEEKLEGFGEWINQEGYQKREMGKYEGGKTVKIPAWSLGGLGHETFTTKMLVAEYFKYLEKMSKTVADNKN